MMKKLLLAGLAATTLITTGCATSPKAPLSSFKIKSDAAPSEVYAAVQQCVLDNVAPPSSGQLFAFQSDKNNSLAFVYNDSLPGFLQIPYAVKATVRYNGKTMTLRPQNVRYYNDANIGRGWKPTSDFNVHVNDMVQRIGNCVPNYL